MISHFLTLLIALVSILAVDCLGQYLKLKMPHFPKNLHLVISVHFGPSRLQSGHCHPGH